MPVPPTPVNATNRCWSISSGQLIELFDVPDERREVVGQVVAADVHRLDGPVDDWQVRMADLEEVLGLVEVLEVVGTEIPQRQLTVEVGGVGGDATTAGSGPRDRPT